MKHEGIKFDISEVDSTTVVAFRAFREAGIEVDANLKPGSPNPILDEVVRVIGDSPDLGHALAASQTSFNSKVVKSGAQACSSVADGGDIHSIGR